MPMGLLRANGRRHAVTACPSPIRGGAWLAIALTIGLAALGVRPVQADVYVGLSTPATSVAPGDTFTVEVVIAQPDSAFNAFDASIRFDPARLAFVPTSPVSGQRGPVMTSACANTFHQFTGAPDSLKTTLSLLCPGTNVTGPGTIYRVRFAARGTLGPTTISLGKFTEFYKAGLFVRPVHKQDLAVTIVGQVGVDPGVGSGGRLEFAPPIPNPRRGCDAVLLEFDLPGPDLVSVDVIDLQGRRLASREAQPFPAGRQRVSWSPGPLTDGEYFLRLNARANGSAMRRWTVLR